MSDKPTSLDRLHDIVVPDEPSIWPLAPGWLVLLSLAAIAAVFLSGRFYRKWRANAYRRAALRELAEASGPAAIAEILRRTSLAVAPRETIASLDGPGWIDWLTARSPEPPSEAVCRTLVHGIYDTSRSSNDEFLRDFAATWIRHHKSPC